MIDASLTTIGAFAGDLVVQAGAGTGKTHALVTLYLHLVTGLSERSSPLPPSKILVITFTDKAAGELRERARARLARIVAEGTAVEETLVEAAARLGREAPSEDTLRRAMAELPRAPIGTFHAFGHSLLRRLAYRVGIDPDFALLDDAEARARAEDAARAAILSELATEDRDVEALVDQLGFGGRDGHGLVETIAKLRSARAEEGRTAEGIASAYEAGRITAERIAATAAMRATLGAFARLRDAVGDKSVPRIQTIASAQAAPELDDERARALIAKLRPEVSAVRASKGAEDLVRDARERYHDAVHALLHAQASLEAAPRAFAIERLVGDAEARYRAWKRGARCVDFSDLIVMPRDLLREHPSIAQHEADRFDALLLDEFQDTNAAQAELIRLLTGSRTEEASGRRFVVGDRKQSIYEFRGADVGVFTEVTVALREAGAEEVILQRSFRSTPKVVALCNELFARSFGAGPPVASWALAFDRERDALRATRDDTPDAGAELLRVPRTGDAKPRADQLRRGEATAIARRARAFIDGGRRPGEIALLLRRYTHLATYLGELARAGLPYYVVRGRGFYEAQEIRDLASLLALLQDGDDRFALLAVLRSPFCGLSDESLVRLEEADALRWDVLSRETRADLPAEDCERLSVLVSRVKRLEGAMERLGASGLLRAIVDDFDLRAIVAGTADGPQKIANIEQLIDRAAQLEADAQGAAADLPRFSRWVSRAVRPQAFLNASEAQIVDERDDVIRVMSIHQAKGLQFPIVFVADCGAHESHARGPVFYDASEGIGLSIPSSEPGEWELTTASAHLRELRTARQRAESLRLFYVAATRAQDRVVFSGEEGRNKRTWRAQLDALLEDPVGSALLSVVEPVEPAPAPPVETASEPMGRLIALEPFVRTRASSLEVAVTQLQDFATCQRRYHFFHELRLDERGAAVAQESPREELDAISEVDPLAAGTLAHRLLERCRFGLDEAATREDLQALLREHGYDPDDASTHAIQAHVLGFLATPYARTLTDKTVRRELPFSLALPAAAGTTRVLRGQIDLIVLDETGVQVVDYKHARRSDREAYRFQLDAYALAARALYPGAPRVVVGLSFLRETDPSPVWAEPRPFEESAKRLGELADELALARLHEARPGIARPMCEAVRCGYVSWCHGEEQLG